MHCDLLQAQTPLLALHHQSQLNSLTLSCAVIHQAPLPLQILIVHHTPNNGSIIKQCWCLQALLQSHTQYKWTHFVEAVVVVAPVVVTEVILLFFIVFFFFIPSLLCNSSHLFAPSLPCLKLLRNSSPLLPNYALLRLCLALSQHFFTSSLPIHSDLPLMIKILKPITEWYTMLVHTVSTIHRLSPQISCFNNAFMVRTPLQINQLHQFTVHFKYHPCN